MKKTKVIIPALGILLLSTAASVTGTVAWFSTNKVVTATGMTVTAKSDSSFLLIGDEDSTKATIQAANSISATAKNSTAELLPVAHKTIANTSAAKNATNWYFMYSDDPDDALSGADEELAIPSGHFGDYVLENVFNIIVASGGRTVENLKVDTITITTTGDSAVKVLVTSDTAAQEFAATDTTNSDNTVLSATVTSAAVVPIHVFIFWDGNNTNVFTSNVDNLLDTSVEIEFTYEGILED